MKASQRNKLDSSGKDLMQEDAKHTEKVEDAEPKFTRKRATIATKVAYNSKTKRYTYYDNKAITAGEQFNQVRNHRLIPLLLLSNGEERIH